METLSQQDAKSLQALHTGSGRKRMGKCLVEGIKVIEEIPNVEEIFITQDFFVAHTDFLADHENIPTRIVSDRIAKNLSKAATLPGVFAIVPLPATSLRDFSELDTIACLVGINDPGNLGTMIRTADWFGVKGIILGGDSVDPYHAKVIRSTMGSVFHIPIYQSSDVAADLGTLKQKGFSLIATDVHGDSDAVSTTGKKCIIMGSESHGLTQEIIDKADIRYTIPKLGKAESLNVAVSFGITLYDIFIHKK